MKIEEIIKQLTKEEIQKIVDHVRKILLGERKAKWGDCENVWIGIAKILYKSGFKPKMIDGFYNGKISNGSNIRTHVWLILDDKIIDGTYDQFGNSNTLNFVNKENKDYQISSYYKNLKEFFKEEMFKKL